MSESTSPPRRSRFRFLYQFSLRTLLLVTAAVAVFCNWYFQPKYHEEKLAGKDLRVQRQLKQIRDLTPEPANAFPTNWSGPPPEPAFINHGHWTLLDGDDFTLARGHFTDDQASGNWVTYYPTGGKAAEGKMLRGVKVGLWRTWYESGTPASEINYAPKPVAREQIYGRSRPFVITVLPVNPGPYRVWERRIIDGSSREGSAKAWYKSGQLQYEGNFQADKQHGLWTFCDEQGRVAARGPFRNGKRHGLWTLTRSASEGQTQARRASEGPARDHRTVRYITGRTEEELNRLLARLEAQLQSPQLYRRQQALIDLAEIGTGAVPLLERQLAHSDPHEQAAVLAVLPRMKAAAEPLLPRVRELSRSNNKQVAHLARLTLFQLDAGSRPSLFDGLLAEAVSARTAGECLGELVLLYQHDQSHRAATFGALMSLPCQRSDIESERIAGATAELKGDLTPHFVAAAKSPDERVRLQAAKTLLSLGQSYWSWNAHCYVEFDEPGWKAFIGRLKSDSSSETRVVAGELEQCANNGPGGGFSGGGGLF